jgi:hypothetical protein
VKQHRDAVFGGVNIGFNVSGTVFQGFLESLNGIFIDVTSMLTQAAVGKQMRARGCKIAFANEF